MLGGMGEDRQLLQDYLRRAAEAAGTDLTGLARKAGLSPSTITRFVNGDEKHLPSTRTLTKVAEASGLVAPIGARQRMSKPDKIQLLAAIADAIDVDLTEAAAVVGGELSGSRAIEWLDVIAKLPAATEQNAFQMLRGMGETSRPPQQDGGPRKLSGGRRRAKTTT